MRNPSHFTNISCNSSYPRSEFTAAVRYKTEELYFEQAQSDQTLPAYEKFLKRYPRGVFADDARAAVEKLSFEQAVQKNTAAAYEGFLKRYPRGKSANPARLQIEKLHFERARAENTSAAYDGFLKRYPRGAFANEARSRQRILSAGGTTEEWGKIMYPRPQTNIRAKRSVSSPVKGQLKADKPVKADFLRDSWYAVFPVSEKRRSETLALGYVYAPLLALAERQEASSFEGVADDEKTAGDAPLVVTEAESPAVDVKNITFMAARDGKEVLLIEFSRYYLPAFSGIQGKAPKIVLEIANASAINDDLAVIDTGGRFIRQIRSTLNSKTQVLRIVVDMEPSRYYLVNPAFYEKENLYSLEISEGQK